MATKEGDFESFRSRWNGRADTWDAELTKPEHYVNFEKGYEKFLKFEEEVLQTFGRAETGIDLGCGTGIAAGPLSNLVDNLYLVDVAELMLSKARQKHPEAVLLHSSVTAIPVNDEIVDYAVSRGVVISHLPAGEQGNFLSEVHRILKPGGVFVFDFLNNLQTADFHLSSEKTVYTIQGIIQEINRYGFEVIRIDGDEKSRVVRIAVSKA